MHPLVDACSAGVIANIGLSFDNILLYGIIAFAFQFPLGVLLDVRPALSRYCYCAAGVLLVVGAMLAIAGLAAALPVACMGNALFHLTAGKMVLDESDGKGGPAGLFISTGAFGLAAGLALGRETWFLPSIAVAIALWHAVAVFSNVARCAPAPYSFKTRNRPIAYFALLLLFALTAGRSWAGLLAQVSVEISGLASVCAAISIWAGKVAGGYLGDVAGRVKVVAVGIAGTVALVAAATPACGGPYLTHAHASSLPYFALLVVSQLATGSMMSLMCACLPGRFGTVFGLNCLALFLGSLWQ